MYVYISVYISELATCCACTVTSLLDTMADSDDSDAMGEEGELTPSPKEEPPFLPGFQTLQDYSKVRASSQ